MFDSYINVDWNTMFTNDLVYVLYNYRMIDSVTVKYNNER